MNQRALNSNLHYTQLMFTLDKLTITSRVIQQTLLQLLSMHDHLDCSILAHIWESTYVVLAQTDVARHLRLSSCLSHHCSNVFSFIDSALRTVLGNGAILLGGRFLVCFPLAMLWSPIASICCICIYICRSNSAYISFSRLATNWFACVWSYSNNWTLMRSRSSSALKVWPLS